MLLEIIINEHLDTYSAKVLQEEIIELLILFTDIGKAEFPLVHYVQ
jgi:hypothetical protein